MKEKTKLEIIEETSKYKWSTRAYYEGVCFYLAPNGNMCGVGRCQINPQADWYGFCDNIKVELSKQTIDLEESLKPEYRGHSSSFWRDIQFFHDKENHWDDNGITILGLKYMNELIEKWGNK